MDDARLFVCARCRRQVLICSRCDRGQQYCAGSYRTLARRESLCAAGRRYQQSRRGRHCHAERQRRYRRRCRKGAGEENVTHRRFRIGAVRCFTSRPGFHARGGAVDAPGAGHHDALPLLFARGQRALPAAMAALDGASAPSPPPMALSAALRCSTRTWGSSPRRSSTSPRSPPHGCSTWSRRVATGADRTTSATVSPSFARVARARGICACAPCPGSRPRSTGHTSASSPSHAPSAP